jgi:hypothetical protein
MASKTALAGFSGDDWKKWLAIAGALVAAGVLPQRWAKGIGLATAATMFFGL